jgi:hypothetical protein
MVDAVPNRASGDRSNGASDERTTKGVSTAGVIADDRTGERAGSASGHGTLLGVRAGANAAGQKRRQCE